MTKPSDELTQMLDILDTPFFEVDSFVQDLLFKHDLNLDELISIESRISRQLMNLDGDLQSMVYESYTRIIGASKSLTKVKDSLKFEFLPKVRNLREMSRTNSELGEILKKTAPMTSREAPVAEKAAFHESLTVLRDHTNVNKIKERLLIAIDSFDIDSLETVLTLYESLFNRFKRSKPFERRLSQWTAAKLELSDRARSSSDVMKGLRMQVLLGQVSPIDLMERLAEEVFHIGAISSGNNGQFVRDLIEIADIGEKKFLEVFHGKHTDSLSSDWVNITEKWLSQLVTNLSIDFSDHAIFDQMKWLRGTRRPCEVQSV